MQKIIFNNVVIQRSKKKYSNIKFSYRIFSICEKVRTSKEMHLVLYQVSAKYFNSPLVDHTASGEAFLFPMPKQTLNYYKTTL